MKPGTPHISLNSNSDIWFYDALPTLEMLPCLRKHAQDCTAQFNRLVLLTMLVFDVSIAVGGYSYESPFPQGLSSTCWVEERQC